MGYETASGILPSMPSLKKKLAQAFKDPIVVPNRIYYWTTGISIRTLEQKSRTLDLALESLSALAERDRAIPYRSIVESVGDCSAEKDCRELADLFRRYGSDKATKHDYYLLYAALLKEKRQAPLRILEIGLGTNNEDVPSNMGRDGKPGASLRAFRDWGPRTEVFGADVDTRVLFSEDRIKTFFVDQNDRSSLEQLAARFEPESFDLIIDDGLHEPWADLNTLNTLIGLVAPGGSLAIEDVREEYTPLWKAALSLIPADFRCELIRTKVPMLVLCTRLSK